MARKSLLLMMTERAYLPEAYAYQRYLQQRGWVVELVNENADVSPDQLAIKFMGFAPRWRVTNSRRIIHEYHSRSTGQLAAAKDLAKSWLSTTPVARIFLNDYVKHGFRFNDQLPFIYRDMAVDEAFYRVRRDVRKNFDVVFCGTIDRRPGLIEALQQLDQCGLSVLLIGHASDASKHKLGRLKHVVVQGRVDRDQIPALISQARFGLNYTPDLRPFNQQTSTKTLEYLAAGLGVISNRYAWAEMFSTRHGANFVWLDDVKAPADLDRPGVEIDMTSFEWSQMLDRCGFEDFLSSL